MLKRYEARMSMHSVVHIERKRGDWVRYTDVAPLLKRLAELEAKEQKREQFDQESA